MSVVAVEFKGVPLGLLIILNHRATSHAMRSNPNASGSIHGAHHARSIGQKLSQFLGDFV